MTDEELNDLRARLVASAEQVCRYLLPGGKRSGNKWICGGVDGGPGKSMDVVLDGEKAGLWNDRATDDKGDMINLWMSCRAVDFKEAVRLAADFLGMQIERQEYRPRVLDHRNFRYDDNFPDPYADDDAMPAPPPPGQRRSMIDWPACVAELDDDRMTELAEWRGFSMPFVQWLKAEGLIGIHRGNFALPVHDREGRVVRVHYKIGDKGWAYYPTGGDNAPLIINDIENATHTLAFESQWDAFAILDKLKAHEPENAGRYAAIITRGATSNTDFSKYEIEHLIACPQNDPEEKRSKTTGRTPAEEWLFQIQTTRKRTTQFSVADTPKEHKDANDWIRADDPDHFRVFATVIDGAVNPVLKEIKTVRQLLEYPVKNDPDSLIGYDRRFLGKAGTWMIIGPSGIGKSTLTTGIALHASMGVDWNGVKFRRPLRTLVIQAENDEGDLAEMVMGIIYNATKRGEFTKSQLLMMQSNLMFRQVVDKTGQAFCNWLEEAIRESGADLVVIDPVLSYVGDDISQQKVVSNFFRNGLNPALIKTGAMAIIIHHTGKPPKDKRAGTKGWTETDYSYQGLGSSDLVNWARAVSVIMETQEPKVFMFKITKRGSRAGMVNQFTLQTTSEIYLRQGTEQEGIAWFQSDYKPPEDDEEPQYKKKDKRNIPTPAELLDILPACSTREDVFKTIRGYGLTISETNKAINDLQLARKLVKSPDGYYRKE